VRQHGVDYVRNFLAEYASNSSAEDVAVLALRHPRPLPVEEVIVGRSVGRMEVGVEDDNLVTAASQQNCRQLPDRSSANYSNITHAHLADSMLR
jgi:hypothetical protein